MEIRKKKKWRCTLIGTCKHVDIGPLSSGPRTTMSSCFPSHKFLSAYHRFPFYSSSHFFFLFSSSYLFKLDFLSFLSSTRPFFPPFSSTRGIFQTFASFRIILSYPFLGPPSPLGPHHFSILRSFSPPPLLRQVIQVFPSSRLGHTPVRVKVSSIPTKKHLYRIAMLTKQQLRH